MTKRIRFFFLRSFNNSIPKTAQTSYTCKQSTEFLSMGTQPEAFIFRTEKVFVGNLPPTATRPILQKHFAKYGRITDCVIMVNKDGSGRGFGFCEFEDYQTVDRVIDAWNTHYINGQWVEVKRASPENALRKYAKTRRSFYSQLSVLP